MKKQNVDKSSEENKKNPHVSIHDTKVKINVEIIATALTIIEMIIKIMMRLAIQMIILVLIDNLLIIIGKKETNEPKEEEYKPEDINTNTILILKN